MRRLSWLQPQISMLAPPITRRGAFAQHIAAPLHALAHQAGDMARQRRRLMPSPSPALPAAIAWDPGAAGRISCHVPS